MWFFWVIHFWFIINRNKSWERIFLHPVSVVDIWNSLLPTSFAFDVLLAWEHRNHCSILLFFKVPQGYITGDFPYVKHESVIVVVFKIATIFFKLKSVAIPVNTKAENFSKHLPELLFLFLILWKLTFFWL